MDHTDVCFEIENDNFYRTILSAPDRHGPDKTLSVTEKIEKLNKGIDKLNSELESQVLSKHQDLLTLASHASNLESLIGNMQLDADGLLAGIDTLHSQISILHKTLESQSTVLNRIQNVYHILKSASRVLELCRGLEKLNENPSVQASSVYQIEQIVNKNDFDGIKLLTDELLMVKRLKVTIVENASEQLRKGLASGDKNLLLASVNIFNNLHCAKEKIEEVVSTEINMLSQHIQTALNVQTTAEPKKYGEAAKVGPGKANVINSQVLKQQFWENIETLFTDVLYVSCRKIILLQNSLNDLHSFRNYRYVARGFWDKLSQAFCSKLKKSSVSINQCVEVDFPKLLKCYNDLSTRIRYKDFAVQRETLSTWENSFLSKSLGKLLEPVRTMWQLNHSPYAEQVDEAVRAISSALSISLGDKQLSIALATSVAKCIKQMSTEAEQRVCMDNDAGQVIEAPSSSQQKNADLSNILYYFSVQIHRVLMNMLTILSAESVNIIQESLKDISSVAVLQPFCISIMSALDLILGSMHCEVDLNKVDNPNNHNITCSLYMRELQQFVSRCKDIYLSMYHDYAAVDRCCDEIAAHCVKIFVYNVCFVRPITAYGRRKLQIDCKQLVTALSPFVSDLSLLGEFGELRTLHNLLGLTPTEILEAQLKGDSMPHSLVMMLLFSFAGPDLISPHQCAGWTHHRLIGWLSEHQSERQRLEFVTGALQRYQSHVRQNNISKYDDVYPVLLQLLEVGRKTYA
ncbi:conserved oligomeric Golgi complex subunit 5-like isoform X1 [Arctopsyche grandis]|uniref:conserved oligomeric Golgi complex subunit 5-like isoform X1 n=1 Tax=Arctopsyche grandis TaxID=121162 RepID=UPI00406D9720